MPRPHSDLSATQSRFMFGYFFSVLEQKGAMRLCQGFVFIHDGVVARDVGIDQVSDPAKIGITREWLAWIVVWPGLS